MLKKTIWLFPLTFFLVRRFAKHKMIQQQPITVEQITADLKAFINSSTFSGPRQKNAIRNYFALATFNEDYCPHDNIDTFVNCLADPQLQDTIFDLKKRDRQMITDYFTQLKQDHKIPDPGPLVKTVTANIENFSNQELLFEWTIPPNLASENVTFIANIFMYGKGDIFFTLPFVKNLRYTLITKVKILPSKLPNKVMYADPRIYKNGSIPPHKLPIYGSPQDAIVYTGIYKIQAHDVNEYQTRIRSYFLEKKNPNF